MRAAPAVRRWHRRLSVLVGLQLLLWTVSGLVFTLDPMPDVRGETSLGEEPAAPPMPLELVTVREAVEALSGIDGRPDARAPGSADDAPEAGGATPGGSAVPPELAQARLRTLRGRWVWDLTALGDEALGLPLVDAASGTALAEVSEAEARAIAEERFLPPGTPRTVTRIETAVDEYRGQPVPAWRVDFDDAGNSHVYVDARTGEITRVRNDLWRRFDFLWGLHIMDWTERERFHTWWLTGFAVLGVTSSLTGLMLAWLVLRPRRR